LDLPPFVEQGGIGKAGQLFGDRLTPLMEQLSKELAGGARPRKAGCRRLSAMSQRLWWTAHSARISRRSITPLTASESSGCKISVMDDSMTVIKHSSPRTGISYCAVTMRGKVTF